MSLISLVFHVEICPYIAVAELVRCVPPMVADQVGLLDLLSEREHKWHDGEGLITRAFNRRRRVAGTSIEHEVFVCGPTQE